MSDLISRQAAIEALQNHYEVRNPIQNAIMDECVVLISNVPSVQPEPCEDAVSRANLRLMKTEECEGHTIEYAMGWKACIEWIKTLPSAQPTQSNAVQHVESVESVGDCISRQAAIDYCYALINAENPSNPSDEWNYSQERINQTEVIIHHLEFMPSAQPGRKTGKWKHKSSKLAPLNTIWWYECSVCGCHAFNDMLTYFCPKCGADMRGEENEID